MPMTSTLAQICRAQFRKVWAVVLCALAVRVAFMVLFSLPPTLSERSYEWDWGYEQGAVAHSIASGEGYRDPFKRSDPQFPWAAEGTGPTAWCGAGFPIVLGGLIHLTDGPNHATALCLASLNVLLSVSIAVGLLRLGTLLRRETLGWASAWAWALFPGSAYAAASSVGDSVMLGAGIVWFLVLLLKRTALAERGDLPLAHALAPVGLGFGALCLLNPICLALSPGVAAFLHQRFGNRGLPAILHVALPAVLVLAPWSVRNWIQLGTLSPKANLGVELMVGNNNQADGGFHAESHPAYSADEHANLIELGEVAYGARCMQVATGWIRSHPQRFAELTALRVRNFWLGLSPFRPVPLRNGIHKARDWQGWIKWGLYLTVGGLALLGALRYHDERGGRVLLVGTLVCFPIVYYVTHVLERYRQPLEPLLILLAVSALLGRRKSRRETLSHPEHSPSLESEAHA